MAGGAGFPDRGLGGVGGQQERDQGVQGRGVLILEVAEGLLRDRVQMVPGMLPIVLGGIMPVGIAPAPLPGDYLTVLGSQIDAHMAAERLAESVKRGAGDLARRTVGCLVQAVGAGNWVAARKLVDLARDAHPNQNLCLDAARTLDLKDLAAQYADHPEFALAQDIINVVEDAIRLGNREAVNVLIVTAERNLDAVLAADRLLREGAVANDDDQRRLADLCAEKLAAAEAQYM